MIKFLKAAPVVFLIGTMVTAILYQKTLLGIWLTTAITFGTTAYHAMGGCIYLQFHHA